MKNYRIVLYYHILFFIKSKEKINHDRRKRDIEVAKITNIMFYCGLTYKYTKKYLTELINLGLVEQKEELYDGRSKYYYVLADNGRSCLSHLTLALRALGEL